MRVVGCLSWFEEQPAWLAAAVASSAKVVDHVIAVDGAYALFPHAKGSSTVAEHDAIRETCAGTGVGLTLHVPTEPWYGNEVEKRAFMLRLAMTVAEPHRDWLFMFDADDLVQRVPGDLRGRLAATDLDVAGVSLTERYDVSRWEEAAAVMDLPSEATMVDHPKLYRALPGIRVERTHWLYMAGEGDDTKVLWGPPEFGPVPRMDCSDLVVEHRTRHRDRHRQARSKAYYTVRTQLGIERLADVYVEHVDGDRVLLEPAL